MATQFKIESGIPAPASKRGKYPFPNMLVGQSFLAHERERNRLSNAAAYHGRRLGMQFTIRATPEGLRIWRIA